MVAGTTLFKASVSVKLLLFGSNDAASIASLNTTWTLVPTGTLGRPLLGNVDTTAGATRSIPDPVVNDWDGKLDCGLPVMSMTPVTLMVYTVPGASGTRGSNWTPRLPS